MLLGFFLFLWHFWGLGHNRSILEHLAIHIVHVPHTINLTFLGVHGALSVSLPTYVFISPVSKRVVEEEVGP